jgi:hypothetical protein
MNALARMTGAVVMAVAALPLLLLTACSHAAASKPAPGAASPPVTMAYCGSAPQVRPAVVEVICGTDDITADSLTWSAWGQQVATAIGTAVVDLCSYEDCHTGSFTAVPIVVIASKMVGCAKNTHAYSRLQYVFVDGSPFAGVPAEENFSNFMADPTRSGPPHDQTVSLTC